jgi:hypothetical protein
MSGQLAQQAKESLGTRDLVMITERVADVALRIGQMGKRGLPEVFDRPLPRHGTQRGRSWGWTAVLWRAASVPAGDHRTVSVETSRTGMRHTLSHLTAQVIAPLACRDARLRHLLTHVRTPAYGHPMAHDLQAQSSEGSDGSQAVSRGDAPTVSGAHEGAAAGLCPCGQRKDEPTRPQSQGMMGS